MNVKLHIDRLVLEGLPLSASQGPAVQAALQAELVRLIQVGGIGGTPLPYDSVPRLQTPLVRVAGGTPRSIGERVAASVHQGLGTKR